MAAAGFPKVSGIIPTGLFPRGSGFRADPGGDSEAAACAENIGYGGPFLQNFGFYMPGCVIWRSRACRFQIYYILYYF